MHTDFVVIKDFNEEIPIIWLDLSIGGKNPIYIKSYNVYIYYIDYLREHDRVRRSYCNSSIGRG